MKALIRNLNTGHFLTASGEWSEDENQAKDFESSIAAVSLAKRKNLRNVEVVLRFGLPTYDVQLPVQRSS